MATTAYLRVSTQGVKAQAAAVLVALKDHQLVARPEAFLKVMTAEASLKHYLPLVEKVIGQSQARIFPAQTRHPDKILSLFGPHLYISYRGTNGKTTGYYVPHHAEAQIRQGVEAWSELQDHLRELAALNKERLIPTKAEK
jgi:hypothetical protein